MNHRNLLIGHLQAFRAGARHWDSTEAQRGLDEVLAAVDGLVAAELASASASQPSMPTELPRFCESFRAFIDHADHDTRMLTSEWMHDAEFGRFIADFAPQLSRAGRLGLIASTVPALAHGDEAAYYGEKNPPIVVWWWVGGRWACQHTREAVEAYCKRRNVPVALFDVPRSQDWRRA